VRSSASDVTVVTGWRGPVPSRNDRHGAHTTADHHRPAR
jgi:hypothetical protein